MATAHFHAPNHQFLYSKGLQEELGNIWRFINKIQRKRRHARIQNMLFINVGFSSMMTPRAFDLGTRLISVPFNISASEITSCFILRYDLLSCIQLAGLGLNFFYPHPFREVG